MAASGQFDVPLQSGLCAATLITLTMVAWPEAQTYRDMNRAGYPSREAAQRYRRDLHDALECVREDSVLDMDVVVWPAGLDRTILEVLPLHARTRKCLLRARLTEGDNRLRVYDFLRTGEFGHKSLRELVLVVEGFLCECIENGVSNSEQDCVPGDGTTVAPSEIYAPWTFVAVGTSWQRVAEVLRPLFAAAAELHGTKTLADALNPGCMELAVRMGIATELEGLRLDQLVEGKPGPAAVAAMRLKLKLETLTPKESVVIECRILSTPPETLREIATRFGVTRERIRQIQAKAERKIGMALGNELRIVAEAVKEELGPIAEESAVHRRIDELLPDGSDWTAGRVKKFFRQALIRKIGLTLDHGMYLNERALEVLEGVRVSSHQLADDVGLVDEQQIMASLPSEEWNQFWPWVRERVGLRNLHGALGLRDSAKARVKVALLSIGRPATRAEIGAVCGFEEGQVSTHLSNVPSVVRADKERWGLTEWVDDEYDGIVGEIIQRIEEDGGATTIERLLSELPSKFDVAAGSVRAYMQTPKFVIRDGYISLASKLSVQLRDLEDVIDGRDHSGAPYWTFTVEDRFLDGYSVTGVPPEFARALGCAADGGERIQIKNLSGCRDLSVRWRLSSPSGASLGYLAEPLKLLGLRSGQRVRVTIKGRLLVELSADEGSVEHSAGSEEATAILQRIMQRRKVL